MALSLDQLKKLAKAENLTFFESPDKPIILMGFGGHYGNYQVLMGVELDGRFLLFRTLAYGNCPPSHPHCNLVLQILGDLNYRLRTTKFSWDPHDGEIVGSIEMWIEDVKMSHDQFHALLGAFLPAIDLAHRRISKAMEKGTDDGIELPDFVPPPPEPWRPPEPTPSDSPAYI